MPNKKKKPYVMVHEISFSYIVLGLFLIYIAYLISLNLIYFGEITAAQKGCSSEFSRYYTDLSEENCVAINKIQKLGTLEELFGRLFWFFSGIAAFVLGGGCIIHGLFGVEVKKVVKGCDIHAR